MANFFINYLTDLYKCNLYNIKYLKIFKNIN